MIRNNFLIAKANALGSFVMFSNFSVIEAILENINPHHGI